MKKNILFIAIIFSGMLFSIYSCKRDIKLISPVDNAAGNSFLRIIDAAPNFSNIYNLPDSFTVFINGAKATSFTPNTTPLLTFGSTFPTVSSGYGYIAVPPGTQQIKLSVTGVVNPDSIPIATFTKTFEADKFYTFMITDSIMSSRDSSQMFIQDVYQQPTTGYYNLRLIDAAWNDTTGSAIDIWSTRANRYIYTKIKPGTITSFTQFAYNALYNDTLYVRRTGNPSVTLDTLNAVSFSNQRTYTLYYRGDATSNAKADPKRRHLATYVHQ